MSEITLIMAEIDRGSLGAAEKLLPLVYDELRRLAAQQLLRENASPTIQPTVLVHDAWLRLGGDAQPSWESRRHFFGAAARAMRQILIERARKRKAIRHGGGQVRVDAEEIETVVVTRDGESVADVAEVLDRLAAIDPAKAELVELRYFVGLSIEETAATLGISEATAKRWWAFARSWLGRELRRDA